MTLSFPRGLPEIQEKAFQEAWFSRFLSMTDNTFHTPLIMRRMVRQS